VKFVATVYVEFEATTIEAAGLFMKQLLEQTGEAQPAIDAISCDIERATDEDGKFLDEASVPAAHSKSDGKLLNEVVGHLSDASNALNSMNIQDNGRVNVQLALLDQDIDKAMGRANVLLAEDRDDT